MRPHRPIALRALAPADACYAGTSTLVTSGTVDAARRIPIEAAIR
jgi:hypothetical protein